MPKNFLLLILATSLVFISNALTVSADDSKCAQLFTYNCAECHDIDRGCELIGQSQEEWVELFEFMEEMGADIPEDEQKTLLDCFNKPDGGLKESCSS